MSPSKVNTAARNIRSALVRRKDHDATACRAASFSRSSPSTFCSDTTPAASTEKVTRKTLDSEDHKRLIEEALEEVDFSALAGNGTNEEGR